MEPVKFHDELHSIFLQRIKPIALGLGFYYLCLVFFHSLFLPPGIKSIMIPTAAVSSALFFAIYYNIKHWVFPPSWSHVLGAVMAGIVLINCLLHLYLTGEPNQSTNIALLIIGTGCFFLSSRWLAFVIASGLAGWGVLIWITPLSAEDAHFSFMLMTASTIAVLVHIVWLQSTRRLLFTVDQVQQSQSILNEKSAQLEQAMQDLKTQIDERNRAEDRLRLFIQNAPAPIAMVDKNLNYLLYSKRFLRDFRLEERDLAGCSLAEIFPEIEEEAGAVFLQCLKGESFRCEDKRLVRQDGSMDWLRWEALPWNKSEGEIGGLILMVESITERKQAESALRESEERFRAMADSAPVMIWMSGPDKRCAYFNKTWLDFTGRALEQELGEGWAEGVHPEDYRDCLEKYTASFDARRHFEMEYRLRRADGEYRWVMDRGVPRYLPNGEFAGYIGTCIDISSRILVENQLAFANARLKAVLDAATQVSIIATDVKGLITVFNTGAERMLGYSAEEMIGKQTPAIIHLESETIAHGKKLSQEFGYPVEGCDVFVEQARRGSHEEKEWTYVKKDGSLISVNLAVTAKRDRDGQIIGFLGVATDITERKQFVTLLDQQKNLLGMLHKATSQFAAAEDPRHIFERMLVSVLEMTQSDCGFIGEVLYDQDNQPYLKIFTQKIIASDEKTLQFCERYVRQDLEFRKLDNLLGCVVYSGEPVISNQPHLDSRRGGVPDGHPELHSFLGAPIYSKDRLTGMYGLANRPGGYNEETIEFLQPFASTCGIIIDAVRTDQERMKNHGALQESEARIRAILDNVVDGIVAIDEQGLIESFNPAAERLFGYSEKEVLGQNIKILMPEPYRSEHDRYLADYFHSGIAKIIGKVREVIGLRKDGTIFPLELGVSEMVLGKRRVFSGILRDISKRKEAEEKLLLAQERLEMALWGSELGMWDWNISTNDVFIDEQWAAIMGYKLDEIPHHYSFWEKTLHPDDWPIAKQRLEACFAPHSKIMYEVEYRALHKSGEWKWILSRGRVIKRDEKETPVRMIGTIQDIAERKNLQAAMLQAKEAAEEANRTKSEFLAKMSHELRTPLNSIIGFSAILFKNKNKNLSDNDLNFVERISNNGKHLLELINDILDLSKVEAGKMELRLGAVSLDRLIQETITQLDVQARNKNIELLSDLPPCISPLETDEAKLKQVLINLMGNAIKFTDQGFVKVRVEINPITGRPLRIDVIDTGIGIPEKEQASIFQTFKQADGSASRKYGGTGLGLAISRSFCELMGFRLVVTSKPDEGSTFSILLPASGEDSLLEIDRKSQKTIPFGGECESAVGGEKAIVKRILVIDDEPDSRLMLRHHLEEMDCQVVEAASGEEGLRLAIQYQPDLITLDLMMPHLNGWETLRILKSDPNLKNIPVVVVSIIAKENRGMLLGAVDCLNKPVTRDDLHAIIQRNLGLKGRILLIEGNENDQRTIAEKIGGESFELRIAEDENAARRILEEFVPDIILLDLAASSFDGIAFLEALRKDARFCSIPVTVLTPKAHNGEEPTFLAKESSAILAKSEHFEDNLERIVCSFFAKKNENEK